MLDVAGGRQHVFGGTPGTRSVAHSRRIMMVRWMAAVAFIKTLLDILCRFDRRILDAKEQPDERRDAFTWPRSSSCSTVQASGTRAVAKPADCGVRRFTFASRECVTIIIATIAL